MQVDYLCRHLSQSTTVCLVEEADSANPLLSVPPNFFTFRHPCFVESSSKIASIQNVEKIRPRNVGKSRRTYIITSVHSSHKVVISRQKFVTFTYGRHIDYTNQLVYLVLLSKTHGALSHKQYYSHILLRLLFQVFLFFTATI